MLRSILFKKREKIFACIFIALIVFLWLSIYGINFAQSTDPVNIKQDDYPNHPIKWMVPWSVGGAGDLHTRMFLPFLEKELGVPQIVENIDGGGTQVGHQVLLAAAPDGYMGGLIGVPHLSITVYMQDAPYSIEDFSLINIMRIDPGCAIVLKDSPYQTFTDVIEDAKENPGKVAIGFSQASGLHLYALWLEDVLGVDFALVPYDGGAPGRAALLGGHVDVYFAMVWSNLAMKEQARSVGVMWDERSSLWPEAPTFKEMLQPYGIENVPTNGTYHAFGTSKKFKDTYPERWDKLVNAVKAAHESPGYLAVLKEQRLDEVVSWLGPEKSDEIAKNMDNFIRDYKYLFD